MLRDVMRLRTYSAQIMCGYMLRPVYALGMHVQLDAAGNRVRCKRVGIMYSVWRWPAIRAMDIQRAAGKVPVTVEDVIRSRQETPTGAQ